MLFVTTFVIPGRRGISVSPFFDGLGSGIT